MVEFTEPKTAQEIKQKADELGIFYGGNTMHHRFVASLMFKNNAPGKKKYVLWQDVPATVKKLPAFWHINESEINMSYLFDKIMSHDSNMRHYIPDGTYQSNYKHITWVHAEMFSFETLIYCIGVAEGIGHTKA